MLIATQSAVYRLDAAEPHAEPTLTYQSPGVRRVAAGNACDVIAHDDGRLVILRNGEEQRVDPGIEDEVHSLLILGEDPLRLLIGTEPPHVYQWTEGDEAARRNESLATLDCRGKWHTPWGGPAAVRSLARTGDGWVYADIHVGSIMRSPDDGATWEPVTPDLHEDVHEVATCPASNGRVCASTARAVYVSDDRGKSWHHRSDDLDARYGRAVAVHPEDPDCILTTVSDGPHGGDVHGQLYRTDDAGVTWQHIADGFPASTPHNIDTFHVAFGEDGTAWVCVDNVLYVGRDRGMEWQPFWEAPERIAMLSCR